MKKKSLPPTKGNILIAEPMLGDPNFDRTVVLLADHNEEGTVGFVLNRPIENLEFDELVIDFPSFKAPIYEGGPVQGDNLFFLHRKGDIIPGSEEILPGVFWGGELEVLKEMMSIGLVTDKDIRFFLGYSGWSAGQLEGELEQEAWLVAESDQGLIFQDQVEEIWPSIMKGLGGDYALWHTLPADPSLN